MIEGELKLVDMFGEVTLQDESGKEVVMVAIDPETGERTYDLPESP